MRSLLLRQNSLGFSLMEVMVAMAVSSIVFLISGVVIKQIVDNKQKSDFMVNRDVFTETVRTIVFGDKTKCINYLSKTKLNEALAAKPDGQPITLDNLLAQLGLAGNLQGGTDLANFHVYVHDFRFRNAKNLGLDLKGNRLIQGQMVAVMGPNIDAKNYQAEIIAEPTLAIDLNGLVTDCKYSQEADADKICDVVVAGGGCLSYFKPALEPRCAGRGNFTTGIIAGNSIGGAGSMAESSIDCGYDFQTPVCPAGSFLANPGLAWAPIAGNPCRVHGPIPASVPGP